MKLESKFLQRRRLSRARLGRAIAAALVLALAAPVSADDAMDAKQLVEKAKLTIDSSDDEDDVVDHPRAPAPAGVKPRNEHVTPASRRPMRGLTPAPDQCTNLLRTGPKHAPQSAQPSQRQSPVATSARRRSRNCSTSCDAIASSFSSYG